MWVFSPPDGYAALQFDLLREKKETLGNERLFTGTVMLVITGAITCHLEVP